MAEEENNLVSHARRELEIIGEDPEFIEMYLNVIRAFTDFGHSGGSAMVAIPTINALLQFKNLSPLTNRPEEWMEVGEGMWQSTRNPEAFSDNGGQTHYILSENPRVIHVTKLPRRKVGNEPRASETI